MKPNDRVAIRRIFRGCGCVLILILAVVIIWMGFWLWGIINEVNAR